MSNSDYYDCLIRYKCTDKEGHIYKHRTKLSRAIYFKKIFDRVNAEYPCKFTIIDGSCLNTFSCEFPFLSDSLMICVDMLYNVRNDKFDKCDNIDDLLNAMCFLEINDDTIHSILEKILQKCIGKNTNTFNTIKSLLEIKNLNDKGKIPFLARTLYLLTKDEKTCIKDKLENIKLKHVFSDKSFYDTENKKLIVSSLDKKFVFDGLEYSVYKTINSFGGCETGFWITIRPDGEELKEYEYANKTAKGKIECETKKCKIKLIIFDSDRIISEKLDTCEIPGKIIVQYSKPMRDRFGHIEECFFNNLMVFQFEITFI